MPVCHPSFNTQPPEGGWDCFRGWSDIIGRFQHTAARRRLVAPKSLSKYTQLFQHTAARRRLGWQFPSIPRPLRFQHTAARRRLGRNAKNRRPKYCFNTQPPEGGWANKAVGSLMTQLVSTHSRPKAAGQFPYPKPANLQVSTHSRLKAAGSQQPLVQARYDVSTHSRLKAAGSRASAGCPGFDEFQHTAA